MAKEYKKFLLLASYLLPEKFDPTKKGAPRIG